MNRGQRFMGTRRIKILLFIFVLTCAFTVRVLYINIVPPNLDEVKLLEEAFSFQWSAIPVQFSGHGTGEYLLLGVLARIGTTWFVSDVLATVRSIILTANLLFIGTLFFLVRKIFNEAVAWVTMVFSVVWPWSILTGTIAFGSFIMLPLGTGAVLVLLKYVTEQKSWQAYCGFLLLALTFYSYPSSILWVPFMLAVFAAIYRRRFVTKNTIISFLMMIVFITPLILFYLKNQFGILTLNQFLFFSIPELAGSRFNDVSIFNGRNPVLIVLNYIGNYLSHFYFILLHSDFFAGKIMFNFFAFFWDSIFIYAGIYFMYKNWKYYRFVLLWLLVYPLGTSLTIISEGISYTRDIMALPLLLMVSAFGCVEVSKRLARVFTRYK